MAEKQIVISGLGVVTPIGAEVEEFWSSVLSGKSGLRRETRMDLSDLPCGWVSAWIPDETKEVLRVRWGNANRPWGDILLHECIDQALKDAQLGNSFKRPVGLVWSRIWPGSGGAFVEDYSAYFQEQALRKRAFGSDVDSLMEHLRATPTKPDVLDSSTFVTEIAQRLDAPVLSTRLEATCAGGLRAVAEAARMIRLGKVDMVIVAASVSRSNHYIMAQYAQLMALSRWKGEAQFASTPFDRRRTGMVMNESAGAIILETKEHAERRRARKAYAMVNGAGIAVDTAHITAPSVEMVQRVMRRALDESRFTPGDISAINAHGTSTRLNDLTEATALHSVFGEHMNRIDVSAIKSLTGHGSAASGIVETVATALTLSRGIVPPVVTCTEPDPDCNLRTSLVPIERPVNAVLKNSFGFGGQYASMVFSRSEHVNT
jgi:3-oxoacyl-[acyl-carrier-protein] synthase II